MVVVYCVCTELLFRAANFKSNSVEVLSSSPIAYTLPITFLIIIIIIIKIIIIIIIIIMLCWFLRKLLSSSVWP